MIANTKVQTDLAWASTVPFNTGSADKTLFTLAHNETMHGHMNTVLDTWNVTDFYNRKHCSRFELHL